MMRSCLDREEYAGPFIAGESAMVLAFVRSAWPHLCVSWGEVLLRPAPIFFLRVRRASQICQGFRIDQSLETLSRELFAATALVCPHLCRSALEYGTWYISLGDDIAWWIREGER